MTTDLADDFLNLQCYCFETFELTTHSIVTEKNVFKVLKSKLEILSGRQGSMPNKEREREKSGHIQHIYTVYLAYINIYSVIIIVKLWYFL